MANSLLTGDIQSEESYSEEFQKELEEDERDQSVMQEESNQHLEDCSATAKTSILRRAEQKERPKLRKRVSFDKESIERKRGKVSRRPRRIRTVPVATPLRDFIAIMATFLLTALLSSLLRDQQRQAQQNYLNRKAQAKKKGDLTSRRKQWQQKLKNIQIEPYESGSIEESVVVSSELLSPVGEQNQEDNLQHSEQTLPSASVLDSVEESAQKLSDTCDAENVSADRCDFENEMEGNQGNIPKEDSSLNSDNSMNDSHPESSEASSVTTASESPDSKSEGMVLTYASQGGEHVEL